MKGLFIPEITVEMFRNGCLESIETLMTEGEVYDIEYDPKSEEPERKKGKWLLIDAGYYDYVKCSQCGETLVWGKNFCPNCGSYNGGEESE